MKTVIIIPTYNEKDNIGRLIEALQRQFSRIRHPMRILVVDDNSPDCTARVVRDSQRRYDNVHLIEGQKAGLGAAYIRGMRHALEQLGADAVFEMDADFSHDPADVPRLLNELDQGADFVIGSRYVPGGSIPREWGWIRRMNSRYGNLAARYVAGIYRVRDCTAGFRAIRASLLRQISLQRLGVQGYAFQVALLYEAAAREAKIVEIPVRFVDRTAGASKLRLSDIVEFVVNVWWLRFRSSTTFIKFLIVGGSGVAVNLAGFTVLLSMGVNKYLASPIAIELSVISNFLLNNWWTFGGRRTKDTLQLKGLKFNVVSLVALLVSYTTFVVATILLSNAPPQVQQLIGIVPATLVNYFMNSYWTFKHLDERPGGPKGSSA